MKKSLSLLMAVAACAIGFTLCSCGGGGDSCADTMEVRDFARGAKMFQLLPNNGLESKLYCVSSSDNSSNDNEAVCAGRLRAGSKVFNVVYTYTKQDETTYTMTITNRDVENVRAQEFVEALGFGTTATNDDEGQYVASNIDSLSGMHITFTFNMQTHLVNVVSTIIFENQEEDPPFKEEIYRDIDMAFRVLPCSY